MTRLEKALKRARRDQERTRQEKKTNEVWCLVRFDQNDDTIETFWSEKRVTTYVNRPKKPLYNEMGPPDGSNVPRGYKRTDEQVQGLPGRHAEQVLCNKFDDLLNSYRRLLNNARAMPGLVEIFLSDSPCHDKSNEENGFPKGCSFKLAYLANKYPQIQQWVIEYDKIYHGHSETDRQNAQRAINHLNIHPRITIRKRNTRRRERSLST